MIKVDLDASVIPFPVSAHLVRFLHVVRSKYRHTNIRLSDGYGLRGRRTSKFCRIFKLLNYHNLTYHDTS